MADKVYFWLKLKKDFFKRHDVRIIESMKYGKEMVLFYVKLLCESIDHEGRLRFSDEIPYTVPMLASITDTDETIVGVAVNLFQQLGLLEVLDDGTYLMTKAEKMVGFETDWAKKKREYRDKPRTNEGQGEDNVRTSEGQTEDNSRTKIKIVRQEIDKEKEIEIDLKDKKEKEKRKSPSPYQEIADLYNETCVSFPRLTSLSDARKKAINARLNSYGMEDFKRLFEKAEASAFLKGKNDRNWMANFDWLIKDANMAKVLDGNYDDKAGSGSGRPLDGMAKEIEKRMEQMQLGRR